MRTFAFGAYRAAQIQAFKTNKKSFEREKYKHVEDIALDKLISTAPVTSSKQKWPFSNSDITPMTHPLKKEDKNLLDEQPVETTAVLFPEKPTSSLLKNA